MNGILNILKPPGMTSQNVVSFVKHILKVDKAGHTGTLDPGASGVLPVCIGSATRVSEYLLNDKKSYRAELQIGLRSDTLDKYGKVEVLNKLDISDDKLYEVFKHFHGNIRQLPPMYSAVKHNGVRLYELARNGIQVERKIRDSYIYDLTILNINRNTVLFDVTCSKGTYIRTLCSDIGTALGSDAIMTFLLRTRTGAFKIDDAITLDELKDIVQNEDVYSVLYPVHAALSEYSRIFVNESTGSMVKNGVGFKINKDMAYEDREYDDNILIFDSSNNFIAVGRKVEESNFIKIHKVFA